MDVNDLCGYRNSALKWNGGSFDREADEGKARFGDRVDGFGVGESEGMRASREESKQKAWE